MEIISPILLWKDYNPKEPELSASFIFSKEFDSYKEHAIYFDGTKTEDGVVRIYSKLYEPKIVKGAVIYFPDEKESLDEIPSALLQKNIAVLKVDYMGEALFARHTIYPKSLSFCKGYINPDLIFNAQPDQHKSCWYEWPKLGLRALTLIENLFPGIKAGVIGKGLGAANAFKLGALEENIAAVVTVFNALPQVSGQDDDMIAYRAALDNNSYASLLKSPCLSVIVSNDMDSSLDDMTELIKNSSMIVASRIIEKATRANFLKASNEISAFFCKFLLDEPIEIYTPKISAKTADNNLYFELKSGIECDAVSLFVAFAIENPAYRNWQNIALTHTGENEYIAKTDVFEINEPVYAFANITLKSGLIFSSNMLKLNPKAMGVRESVAKKSRILYDSDLNEDNWFSFDSDYGIHMQQGPFEINGVTCDAHELATFKIGDFKFKGYPDSMLQLIINGLAQAFVVNVTDTNGRVYSCATNITDDTQWTKLTLSPNDFKSPSGALEQWENLVMLELKGTARFIVNSILWV